MVSIFDYCNPSALDGLCSRLELPGQVAERILSHAGSMDLAGLDPHFEKLFSLETGDRAVKDIPALCETAEDPSGDRGLKALAVYLAAALHTEELYRELGIGEAVYTESMKAFRRFVMEHLESYGCYGFDRHFWIYRQLSARLFRLGALEFEMRRLPPDIEPMGSAGPGDMALSVHIPSDAAMTREALDASYRMAREFFAGYFPDFGYRCVYCSSWLLSPVLREVLPPGSKILDFQSDYTITQTDSDDNSGMIWVFKREYGDYSLLPEDTSLMRGLKKILVEGGKIGSGRGYVKNYGK